MKKENTNAKENIENLGKVIEEKKKIPQKIKEKINSKRFENIIFAVIILIYFGALNLGMANIPTENYLNDLRVFAISLLVVTIILFELAYKRDIGDFWIHGVEIMIVRNNYDLFNVYVFNVL